MPYEHRLDFWENFNLCWLALLQRQKDNSQQMISRGQHPTPGQAILQVEVLERMARELVRMCDGLERHGLVDYQMGVWEEEIMNGEEQKSPKPHHGPRLTGHDSLTGMLEFPGKRFRALRHIGRTASPIANGGDMRRCVAVDGLPAAASPFF